jgi:pyruvate,orthophosphate dikinase
MPGMMDTILDLGLNDDTVQGLAKATGQERAAWDSYRRLVQMYGDTVLGVDLALFDAAMDRARAATDLDLGTDDLGTAVNVQAMGEAGRATIGAEPPA